MKRICSLLLAAALLLSLTACGSRSASRSSSAATRRLMRTFMSVPPPMWIHMETFMRFLTFI